MDAFALLNQPRQPWLDPARLKERYLDLTRTQHPDTTAAPEANADFAGLTQAYRALSDPGIRIAELLRLEGVTPPKIDAAPSLPLQDLFFEIANLVNVNPAGAEAKEKSGALRARLEERWRVVQESLRELNALWERDRNEAINQLKKIHAEFSYLNRCRLQLERMAEMNNPDMFI